MERPGARTLVLASVPAALALHGLAREVDRAVGLLLHTSLDLPSFVWTAFALVDRADAAVGAAAWTAGGLAIWAALAAWRRRASSETWREALAAEAPRFSV